MTTTGARVLAYLESHSELDVKKEGGGWKMNSPLRPGSNSHAFSLTIAPDGEHGAFYDHADGGRSAEKGTLYELAKLLNIPLPEQSPAVDTKRKYTGLADYALAHGVPVDVFVKAGWTEGHTVKARSCLQFTVNGLKRWRFLDGGKPTFTSEPGFKACWYGLERAITLAKKNNLPALVLCNGEPSVVAAQHFGLPAFAESGGEKSLRAVTLKELREKWHGAVWIALDCDSKGKAAAQKIAQQIPGAVVVDLKLGAGGDLSDFCGLHGSEAYPELQRRTVETPAIETSVLEETAKAVTSREIARHAVKHFAETMTGKPLIFPFQQFRSFGGFARVLMPKKISAFIAMSGHGKTSFLETVTDLFLQSGEGGVWYGSEWDDMEYHWRRVHRLCGVSYEQMMLLELYKWELDAGVVDGHGVLLTPEEEKRYLAASEAITKWRGQVQYFPAEMYLEDILAHMSDEIAVRRAQGEVVSFAVFDYVQLLRVQDSGTNQHSNMYEIALGLIKTWTERNNLHSLIGSQVTKDGSERNRSNRTLTAGDALFIRDDKTNLFVSLNSIYEEDRDAPREPDGSVPMVITNRAIASIRKNNAGSKGNVHLYTDFPRLRWLDKGWTAYRGSTLDESEAHYADEA